MTSRLSLWSVGIHLTLWYCQLSTAYRLLDEGGFQGQMDLTELIGVPLPPSVSFVTGFEGYPAYSFGPDANVGRLTKSFIPDPFYRDFTVIVTAKPTTRHGGVLFAITDAYQRVVQLGVALSPVEDGSQQVLLYYTDPEVGSTQEAASFKLADLTGRWARFTLTVQGTEVRLYMDCEEYHRVAFQRSPEPLTFEASSGVFVGNAGGTGLDRFVGCIQQLVLKGYPTAQDDLCEEDDPYASGYGSGDDSFDDTETMDEVKKVVEEREYTVPEEPWSTPVRAPPTEASPTDDEDADEISGQDVELTAERGPSRTADADYRPSSGTSSQKGEQGDPGPAGPPGSPGPPGPHSPSSHGFSGGVPGPRGSQGPPGPAGPPGTPGNDGQPGRGGIDGNLGETGAQGFPGLPGDPGPKGDKGDPGVGKPGSPGPPGPPGRPNSSRSPDGVDGSGFEYFDGDTEIMTGPPGPPGPPGLPGPPGSSEGLSVFPWAPGENGKDGEMGKAGLPGVDGNDGYPGPAGERGEKGEPGLSGTHGPKGEPGAAGFPGLPGSEGPEGKPGLRGPPGLPGPPGRVFSLDLEGPIDKPGRPGPKGEDGQDGLPGVAVKGEPGAPGAAGASGLDGLPGHTGAKGDQGDMGPKGERGRDGFSFPGPPGPPGSSGPVINLQDVLLNDTEGVFNFSGLLESQGLRGSRGPKGDLGIPGTTGLKGKKGEPGVMVAADRSMMSELTGLQGPKGIKGDCGVPGPAGVMGPIGPEGPKGEYGYPGRPGRPGIMGHKGDRGDAVGVSGSPGPPGPPGRPGMFNCPKGTVFPIPPRLHCKKAINGSENSTNGGPDCLSSGTKGVKGERGFPGMPAPPLTMLPKGTMGNKGEKGFTGEKGEKGEAGLPGPPGMRGTSGMVGPQGETVMGPPGHPGVPGSPGTPGYGRPGPQGPQGPPGHPGAPSPVIPAVTIPGPQGPAGPPGASAMMETFPSSEVMMQRTMNSREGTLSFITTGTGKLYIRVQEGWKEVLLGNLIYRPVNIPLPDKAQPGTARRYGLNLVALNQPYTGNFGGDDMTDKRCYEQAMAMGLPASYRGFVSSNIQTINKDLVSQRFRQSYPITNLRGDILFSNYKSIFTGGGGKFPSNIPIYSFDGRDVMADPFWPKKSIWHGSNTFGNLLVDRSCNSWQSDNMSIMGQSSNLASGFLLGQQAQSCNNQFIVLCIETREHV